MTDTASNEAGGRRPRYGRRTILRALSLAGVAAVVPATASAEPAFPDVLPLPTGFQPEGVVAGRGHEFFVGSLAAGAVYRGDLRTGAGAVLVPPTAGRVAVGLAYDSRSDSLFVAGGPTGTASVYDATTGATVADYDLQATGTFVNDVVVTAGAAYFTDSFRPALYRVPLGPGGRVPDQSAVEEVPLGGDFASIPGGFNANGIDASPDGDYLVVVNSTSGALYRVDPTSGVASEVDLGGATLTAGDGILLDGTTLYVVRNQLNVVAAVRLDPGATRGEVVDEKTSPLFDVPTTVTEFGDSLYAVNARFGVGDPANASYDVIRVPK